MRRKKRFRRKGKPIYFSFIPVSAPSDLSSDDPIRSQLASRTTTARVPRSDASRSSSRLNTRPFQLIPARVPAHSSSRSSSFQLASDRPARGSLGGPVLQSSKPKGNSNSENMKSNLDVL
ncbi:hypothetical protein F2Q69_00008376 [Brassica cretica]|uniref:Uncharacterized protein n=1 Tax=Brassica cretica TaxID=69181 RepID=A0A8S9PKJ6_BRACR|nr:hypothetical protein F2Q69_00008376 [Brassica cretica]